MYKSLLNFEIAQSLLQARVVEALSMPFIQRVQFDHTAGLENAKKLAEYVGQQSLVLYPDEEQVTA